MGGKQWARRWGTFAWQSAVGAGIVACGHSDSGPPQAEPDAACGVGCVTSDATTEDAARGDSDDATTTSVDAADDVPAGDPMAADAATEATVGDATGADAEREGASYADAGQVEDGTDEGPDDGGPLPEAGESCGLVPMCPDGGLTRWPQLGDTNGDGCVDNTDYQRLLACYGKRVVACSLAFLDDFNGDGYVNFSDYIVLVGHWGVGCDGGRDGAPD